MKKTKKAILKKAIYTLSALSLIIISSFATIFYNKTYANINTLNTSNTSFTSYDGYDTEKYIYSIYSSKGKKIGNDYLCFKIIDYVNSIEVTDFSNSTMVMDGYIFNENGALNINYYDPEIYFNRFHMCFTIYEYNNKYSIYTYSITIYDNPYSITSDSLIYLNNGELLINITNVSGVVNLPTDSLSQFFSLCDYDLPTMNNGIITNLSSGFNLMGNIATGLKNGLNGILYKDNTTELSEVATWLFILLGISLTISIVYGAYRVIKSKGE